MPDAIKTVDGATGNEETRQDAPTTFTQEQVNRLLAEQKREIRAKFADYQQLKADSEKLAEIEEAGKSELERERELAQKLQSQLDAIKAQAELDKIRHEVAKETGVPMDLLRGANEEELRSHADAIKAVMAVPASTVVPTDGHHPAKVATGAKADFADFVSKYF